ncbi:hypothetical protein PILCRDRAFT_10745 [Piloderma croceum F 1598]|uniref:Uncharacterized protein n=1 Tax=Piloderma croceum (strain F 1598) TaxID=765440 RepID=A0A0C3BP81_PILCF|nr:hypothetical protein PILCRDRAFT_10745 [Piloderma croceum F 1598]
MPLADVHNLLGKRPTPHTPPSPSTLGENPTGTPKCNKQHQMDIDLDNLIVENQSPISDHSISGDRGCSSVGRLKRMTLTGNGIRAPTFRVLDGLCAPLPPPSVTSGNLLSLFAKDMLMTLAVVSAVIVFGSSSVRNGCSIADQLSCVWAGLLGLSYGERRAWRFWGSVGGVVVEYYWSGLLPASLLELGAVVAVAEVGFSSIGVFWFVSGVYWVHGRVLADNVLAQLRRGEPVSLPALACLNSQHPDEH